LGGGLEGRLITKNSNRKLKTERRQGEAILKRVGEKIVGEKWAVLCQVLNMREGEGNRTTLQKMARLVRYGKQFVFWEQGAKTNAQERGLGTEFHMKLGYNKRFLRKGNQ